MRRLRVPALAVAALLAVRALAAPPAPPFHPPMLPDALDPGDSASPYEGMPEQGALKSGSSLELTTLSRSIVKFTMTADVSSLARVTAAEEAAIVRHVAADPRWRLVQWGGALIAFRRVKDGAEWTAPLRGYHDAPDGTWRAALRFSAWKADAPWAKSTLVARADAASPTIQATAYPFEGRAGWQATALSWAGPEVALELFEAGAAEDLPHTSEMLGVVPGYVSALTAGAGSVDASGYVPGYLPAKEPKRGEPTVAVTSPAPGELEVRARVNPGGPGVTWVRVLDATLAPWEEKAVATGTREIIGWSFDPEALFYLQGRFPVPAGAAFSGSIEVWHLPYASVTDLSAPSGPAERIGAFPIKIPKR